MFGFNELMSLPRIGQPDKQAQSVTGLVPGATWLTTPDGVTSQYDSIGAIASDESESHILSRKEGEK